MKALQERPVIVLGPSGMLGQMVTDYFTRLACEVIPIHHRFEPETRQDFVREITRHQDAVVINCIGRIKQKTSATGDLVWANAVLPLELANRMSASQTLVQPSTDCVFSGGKGEPYALEDIPDAEDDYGWSKRLGEVALVHRKNTLIPRVSIIGPDANIQPKGLLGWFLNQPNGAELKGFSNHLWNGITTLEWCRLIERELSDPELATRSKLFQAGTKEHHTKLDMLHLFQNVFGTTYTIVPFETDEPVDRRLHPNVFCKSLREQMEDLKKVEKFA